MNNKRVALLALTLASVFLASACGGGGSSNSTTAGNSNGSSSTPPPPSVTPATASIYAETAFANSNTAGLATDASGNLYGQDPNSGLVGILSSTGVFAPLGGANAAANQSQWGPLLVPSGMVIDGSGKVFIADRERSTVFKMDSSGTISRFIGAGEKGPDLGDVLFEPGAITMDSKGFIYVVDTCSGTLYKVDTTGGETPVTNILPTEISSTVTGGSNPITFYFCSPSLAVMTIDPSDNLYIADVLDNVIVKVSPTGSASTIAGSFGISGTADGSGTAANFANISGMAADSAGNIYIADKGYLRKMTPQGAVTTIQSLQFAEANPASTLFGPHSLSVVGGTLYYSGFTADRRWGVGKFSLP